jgi:uncharacterized DUF497 family protein
MDLIMYTDVAIDSGDVEFAWDEAKRTLNLAKHRLDLVMGMTLFDGRPTISYASARNGEGRWVTIGRIDDLILALVWTEREGVVRLISLRRARDAERRAFDTRICH